MGGGDRCFEIVGNCYGVVDAEGDSFCWNRKCKQVGFGTSLVVFIKAGLAEPVLTGTLGRWYLMLGVGKRKGFPGACLIPRVMVYPETVLY
jgi:hypothetical protein